MKKSLNCIGEHLQEQQSIIRRRLVWDRVEPKDVRGGLKTDTPAVGSLYVRQKMRLATEGERIGEFDRLVIDGKVLNLTQRIERPSNLVLLHLDLVHAHIRSLSARERHRDIERWIPQGNISSFRQPQPELKRHARLAPPVVRRRLERPEIHVPLVVPEHGAVARRLHALSQQRERPEERALPRAVLADQNGDRLDRHEAGVREAPQVLHPKGFEIHAPSLADAAPWNIRIRPRPGPNPGERTDAAPRMVPAPHRRSEASPISGVRRRCRAGAPLALGLAALTLAASAART